MKIIEHGKTGFLVRKKSSGALWGQRFWHYDASFNATPFDTIQGARASITKLINKINSRGGKFTTHDDYEVVEICTVSTETRTHPPVKETQ